MKIVKLSVDESELARQLFVMMANVFEEPCDELSTAYLNRLFSLPSFWAYAAMDDDRLMGGLTAHTLPMTKRESSEIFIYDIAVLDEYQRRGIGRQLVAQLRTDAAAVGIHDIFVPADNEDLHALDFYRALGAEEDPVTFFTFGALEG